MSLTLKLHMVNQYLDDQISGIVKETFDYAIRNNTLNQIHEQLEASFSVEKTKMLLTIRTAYSNVFYSSYDIEGYTDAYFKRNLESEIAYYTEQIRKKTPYPDDWIRNKKTGEYIWDENVIAPNDPYLSKEYTYVGKEFEDIRSDFDNNASWMDKVREFAGSGGPRINISSYVSAKLRSKIENAILSQRDAYKRMIEGKNISRGFYPKDFNIPNLSLKTGILSSNEYPFETILCIEERPIKVKGIYIVRNEKVNFVSTVYNEKTQASAFGTIFHDPFIFAGKANTVILEIDDLSQRKFLNDFIVNTK